MSIIQICELQNHLIDLPQQNQIQVDFLKLKILSS